MNNGQKGLPTWMTQQQGPKRVQMDRKLCETVACWKCGGVYFEYVLTVVRIPAVVSPSGVECCGEEVLLRCRGCGRVRRMLDVGVERVRTCYD